MPTSPAPARTGRSCPLCALKKEAARANGAKSRGPKTAEGKLASSRNALTHGLTARTVVLQNESQDDYHADLRAYLDHFRPQSKPETDLVHQLAAAQWRLVRYTIVESALLEQKMDEQADQLEAKYEIINERHRLAIAFESLAGANGSLALLNRYQARLHREYQRILKTLTDLQAARHARESTLERKQKLPNEPKPAPQLSLDPERDQNLARHAADESVDDESVGSDRGYGMRAIPALKAAATSPAFSQWRAPVPRTSPDRSERLPEYRSTGCRIDRRSR